MACSKPMPATISFAEIIHGRDASVRLTDDRLLYAVDLVTVMTGKNCNDSNECLRGLNPCLFNREKFTVRSRCRLLTFEHAIELIMVLPGKTAKAIRKQFKDIIVRYLDGDRSMCHEIEKNNVMGKIKSYTNFARKIMTNKLEEDIKKAYEIPQTCYVYATKSPAFPGLIKIGKTMDVSKRLTQLNTSCAPAPHVIVAVAPTLDEDRDEKTAHTFFSSARREGEFFELQETDVITYFNTHILVQYNAELAQHIARLQGLSV
jgi:hypothetical protein